MLTCSQDQGWIKRGCEGCDTKHFCVFQENVLLFDKKHFFAIRGKI